MDFDARRVHLLGIGGAGMSALVPLLSERGARVSGCDLAGGTAVVQRLRDDGIRVALGHDPSHLAEVDLVVHSSAVPAGNAELRAAQSRGLPVLSRSACLAELMRGLRTIAVAGSHGKTSTTWMIGHLLERLGRDPVIMLGGSVPERGFYGGRVGRGGIFVAEVDESDGGFRHVAPQIAVLTNLDGEHQRHYGGMDELRAAFRAWLQQLGPEDVLVYDEDVDPQLLAGLRARLVRCGLRDDAGLRAEDVQLGAEGSRCTLVEGGRALGELRLQLPGQHMLRNALLAMAAVRQIDPDCGPALLADCERVRRRFTEHGRPGGVRVIEDYAHHPTELRATIAAAALGGGRVHALFQPHRYSRTLDCFTDFPAAVEGCTSVAILPTYAAGEDALPGSSGRELAEAIAEHRRIQGGETASVQFAPHAATAIAFLAARVEAGDSCLVLGAGDVGDCVGALLEALG